MDDHKAHQPASGLSRVGFQGSVIIGPDETPFSVIPRPAHCGEGAWRRIQRAKARLLDA